MVPRPGDPPKPPSAVAGHIPTEGPMEEESEAVVHARTLLNIQLTDYVMDNKAVQNAVIFWKLKADSLRSAGLPLFINAKNAKDIDPSLLAEARELDNFLDELITTTSVKSEALYTRLRLLVAGGEPFEDFRKTMKELDYSLKCNVIWENDSVAYRCNTCARTPCMSLCAECFLANGHEGHDFTRFFSREGGACDCGNADVLYETGFCHRHGENSKKPEGPIPQVSMAEYIYMKLLVHLFLQFRGFKRRMDKALSPEENLPFQPLKYPRFCEHHQINYNFLVAFLQECVSFGGPMREAMSNVLLDEELYKALTEDDSSDVSEEVREGGKPPVSLDWRTRGLFEEDLMSLQQDNCHQVFHMPEFPEFVRCSHMLHELLIWIFRVNFPQSVINLSLSMLSEPPYLDAISKSFFKWYPVVAGCMRSLCQAYQSDHNLEAISGAGSRIIHISVQMLSSSVLCAKLDREVNLVQTIFESALYLLTECTNKTDLCLSPSAKYILKAEDVRHFRNPEVEPWDVITLDNNKVITQHGYWFVMGDIQNLMSHIDVALSTLRKEAFSQTYINLVSAMQGMSVNWRIVSGDHQMNDGTEIAHRSFTLEYETLSITMFNFVAAVLLKEDEIGACLFFDTSLKALEKWLRSVTGPNCEDVRSCPAYNFSYHLPLHRHVSVALTHFNRFPLFRTHTQSFRNNEQLLRLVMLHPLAIQVGRMEYMAGMWVRNGSPLRIQSMIYAQSHINQSFLTPDIDMLRFCAANVDPEWFISSVLESFHIDDVLEIQPFVEDGGEEAEDAEDAMEVEEEKQESPFVRFIRMFVTEFKDYVRTTSASEDTEAPLADNVAESQASGDTASNTEGTEEMTAKIMGLLKNFLKDDPDMADVEDRVPDIVHFLQSKPRFSRVLVGLDEAHKQNVDVELPKFKLKKGPVLSAGWKGEERSKVLLRYEWFDPMLNGTLLMMAELVVIRLNSGFTDTEALRSEMVHELAIGPLPFSQLRSSMAEKGSRGGSVVDAHFEEILREIADFHEPDRAASGKMEQGTYSLKHEIWKTDFCPVMCHMRAPMPARGYDILRRVEEMDKATLPPDQRQSVGALWIPYRLFPINQERPADVANIPRILYSNRFIQLAMMTLMYRKNVKETTVQMAVYLLTVGAHYAAQLRPNVRPGVFNRYFTDYCIMIKDGEGMKEVRTSLFYQLYAWFTKEAEKKGCKVDLLDRVLNGELRQERIVGGAFEYLGRFLSILQENHQIASVLLNADKRSFMSIGSETPSKEAMEAEAKKQRSANRRSAVMAAVRKKNQELMKKHMANEGLSQTEVDRMDISNRKVRLYECPFCGVSDAPSTISQPLGMLVKLTNNNLANLRMGNHFQQPSLFDAAMKGESLGRPKRGWDMSKEAEIEEVMRGTYEGMIIGTQMSADIKTCGHTAHIACFEGYRQTQHQHHELRVGADISKLPVSCPMCRTSVDCVLPLRFDSDIALGNGSGLDDPQKAFAVFRSSVENFKKEYEEEEQQEHFEEHYEKYTDMWLDRIRPVDRSRHQPPQEKPLDKQSKLATVVKTIVEKNLVLASMNIPERGRENCRSIAIEHLIPAIVYHTNKDNQEVCLFAARDLFAAHLYEPKVTSTGTAEPPPDALAEMQTEMSVEDILQSTPKPTPEEEQRKKEEALRDRSGVPLLMYDHRLLFIRLSSYILNNDTLTPVEQKTLVGLLTTRLLWAAAVKCAVRLLHRVTPQLAKEFLEGEFGEEISDAVQVMKTTAQWYSKKQMVQSLLSILSNDEYSLGDKQVVLDTLRAYVAELEAFCREFIYSSALYERSETIALPAETFSSISTAIPHWLEFYTLTMANFRSTSVLHRIPLVWKARTLLQPPEQYDTLFSKFFRKKCHSCDKAPSIPLLCMFCGKLVCLDDCCNIHGRGGAVHSEVEQHARGCTGLSCVFLALNNSVVVVTNGASGAVWGSIYLDAHGEEDRNLRRGKPLYLAEKRLTNLLNDWAEQEWGRAGGFSSLTSLFQQLRDAHVYLR